VDGSGSIATGGPATFSLSVRHGRKGKTVGSFSYSDPARPLSFTAGRLTSLSINGNHARFTGSARLGKHHKMTFTVDVTDFGDPGTLDTLSIAASDGYSANGNLVSGNLRIH
jgi:hypothetical protein